MMSKWCNRIIRIRCEDAIFFLSFHHWNRVRAVATRFVPSRALHICKCICIEIQRHPSRTRQMPSRKVTFYGPCANESYLCDATTLHYIRFLLGMCVCVPVCTRYFFYVYSRLVFLLLLLIPVCMETNTEIGVNANIKIYFRCK